MQIGFEYRIFEIIFARKFARVYVYYRQSLGLVYNEVRAVFKRDGIAEQGFHSVGQAVIRKHMPGHMGHVQVTVQNLEVVRVDAEKNLLLVKGAVPGPKKALVTIKETVKVEA